MTLPHDAVAQLWRDAQMPEDALGWLTLTGRDPVLPSSFAVGAAAQSSLAAAGLAAAALHRLRTGVEQFVSVAMRDACAEFVSERLIRIDGQPPPELWDSVAGLYPTADGYVRLHTNFPHHREGVLRLLDCAGDRASVAAALGKRRAVPFEEQAQSRGLCVTALRTRAEWEASPQGLAVVDTPLRITRIGDAPPQPLPAAARPLSGVRVLDLTRVIAGPVCCRTLAAHGADVLMVTGPHLPNLPGLLLDTSRGKRAAALDLRDPAGREALHGLVREGDVFVQGYRPGGLAAKGFGPGSLAIERPGLVCASLTAYGEEGPWSSYRGFDSLVQTASGFNTDERDAAGDPAPRVLPCQALDHASGALMAFGVMAALHRRATEGGSWLVRVSLAGTGRWLRSLGRVADGFDGPAPDWTGCLEQSGAVFAARHAARLSATPPAWTRPAPALGADPPDWLDRDPVVRPPQRR